MRNENRAIKNTEELADKDLASDELANKAVTPNKNNVAAQSAGQSPGQPFGQTQARNPNQSSHTENEATTNRSRQAPQSKQQSDPLHKPRPKGQAKNKPASPSKNVDEVCITCDRLNIRPFIPVRYALGEFVPGWEKLGEIPTLDEMAANDFALSDAGLTLRRLRDGWLYVLYQHEFEPKWRIFNYATIATSDGQPQETFREFELSYSSKENEEGELEGSYTEDRLTSCKFAYVERGVSDIWIAFSTHVWTEELKQKAVDDQAFRESIMIHYNLEKIVKTQVNVHYDKLQDLVEDFAANPTNGANFPSDNFVMSRTHLELRNSANFTPPLRAVEEHNGEVATILPVHDPIGIAADIANMQMQLKQWKEQIHQEYLYPVTIGGFVEKLLTPPKRPVEPARPKYTNDTKVVENYRNRLRDYEQKLERYEKQMEKLEDDYKPAVDPSFHTEYPKIKAMLEEEDAIFDDNISTALDLWSEWVMRQGAGTVTAWCKTIPEYDQISPLPAVAAYQVAGVVASLSDILRAMTVTPKGIDTVETWLEYQAEDESGILQNSLQILGPIIGKSPDILNQARSRVRHEMDLDAIWDALTMPYYKLMEGKTAAAKKIKPQIYEAFESVYKVKITEIQKVKLADVIEQIVIPDGQTYTVGRKSLYSLRSKTVVDEEITVNITKIVGEVEEMPALKIFKSKWMAVGIEKGSIGFGFFMNMVALYELTQQREHIKNQVKSNVKKVLSLVEAPVLMANVVHGVMEFVQHSAGGLGRTTGVSATLNQTQIKNLLNAKGSQVSRYANLKVLKLSHSPSSVPKPFAGLNLVTKVSVLLAAIDVVVNVFSAKEEYDRGDTSSAVAYSLMAAGGLSLLFYSLIASSVITAGPTLGIGTLIFGLLAMVVGIVILIVGDDDQIEELLKNCFWGISSVYMYWDEVGRKEYKKEFGSLVEASRILSDDPKYQEYFLKESQEFYNLMLAPRFSAKGHVYGSFKKNFIGQRSGKEKHIEIFLQVELPGFITRVSNLQFNMHLRINKMGSERQGVSSVALLKDISIDLRKNIKMNVPQQLNAYAVVNLEHEKLEDGANDCDLIIAYVYELDDAVKVPMSWKNNQAIVGDEITIPVDIGFVNQRGH